METRDLIIETAFMAFIDHGYDRVSLNKIIKTTGLTKGAFYHYFSSKDQLIGEVMNTYFYGHLQKTMDVVDVQGQTFSQRMDLVFKNVMNVDIRLVSQPQRRIDRNDFSKLLWDAMNLNEAMRLMNAQYQDNVVEVMKRALEAGMRDGEIRQDIDPLKIARVISASVRGTIMTTYHLPEEASEVLLRENVGTIMTLILQRA